jgi:hypothetical protein
VQLNVEAHPTEFQQRAAIVSFQHMLKGDRYCTWTIRRIAKAIAREHSLGGPDWDALKAVNGVEWMAMGPELATAVRTKTAKLLGLPPEAFVTPEAVKITRSLVDHLLGRGR